MESRTIKTFQDVLDKLNITEDKILPNVSCYPKQYQKSLTAFHKLILITKALNDGWVPDWDNTDELKYTPYFNMGCGFSFRNVLNDYAYADAASCLYFKSEKLAKYCATQFLDIWKDYLEIDNSQKHAREQMMEIENNL